MKNPILLILIPLILGACGSINHSNFSKRKFLNLKSLPAPTHETSGNVENTYIDEVTEHEKPETANNSEISAFNNQSESSKNTTITSTIDNPVESGEKEGHSETIYSIKKNPDSALDDDFPSTKTNTMGIIGFVMLCLSLFLGFTVILAIIFGAIAIVQINKNPDKYENTWVAYTALIGGFIVLILSVGLIFLFLFLL